MGELKASRRAVAAPTGRPSNLRHNNTIDLEPQLLGSRNNELNCAGVRCRRRRRAECGPLTAAHAPAHALVPAYTPCLLKLRACMPPAHWCRRPISACAAQPPHASPALHRAYTRSWPSRLTAQVTQASSSFARRGGANRGGQQPARGPHLGNRGHHCSPAQQPLARHLSPSYPLHPETTRRSALPR